MDEKSIIKRILENQQVPDKLRTYIEDQKYKVSVFGLPSKRVITLYEIRQENTSGDPAFKEVNLEIEKILNQLRKIEDAIVLIFNVIGPDKYAIIFQTNKSTKY